MKRILAVALLVSCQSENQPTEPTSPRDEVPFHRPLPVLFNQGDCAIDEIVSVTACEWATAPDIIAWGRVEEIRLLDAPSVLHGEVVDECTGSLNPAMQIKLVPEIYLRGDGPETLTLFLGHEQITQFQPTPARDYPTYDLMWLGDQERAIQPGQMLGVAAYWLAEPGLWTVADDLLFDFAPCMAFQSIESECGSRLPGELIGATQEEIRATIQECDATFPDSGAQHRELVALRAQMGPASFYAGVCSELDNR